MNFNPYKVQLLIVVGRKIRTRTKKSIFGHTQIALSIMDRPFFKNTCRHLPHMENKQTYGGLLIALVKYIATKPGVHKIFNIYAKLTTLIETKNKIHLLKIS